jgi:hypothetical protein
VHATGLTALFPLISGCALTVGTFEAKEINPQRRFKGISIVFVEDAVAGAKMNYVSIVSVNGMTIDAPSLLALHNRGTLAVGPVRVPSTVRVVWREGTGWDDFKKIWNIGTIVGDYTVPVAERIPDEVLADIRTNGGSLRLKFRLKPDGVLFGWDIERDGAGTGYSLRYDMPGGDFKAARIVNGRAAEPGWQVMSDGQKMQTDY